MLPSIQSKSTSDRSSTTRHFEIDLKGIEDLFYDGETKPKEEIQRIQHVLNMEKNCNSLNSIYSRRAFNRRCFQDFAFDTCGIDSNTADEIFSCATNSFADADDNLPDFQMSTSEFVAAIVRLANLWVLMNEGMVDASRLSSQTSSFLKSIREQY